MLWDCLPSYPEYGYSIYAINTKWNNDTNGGLYFYTGRPEPYDEVLIYRLTNDTWYGPRTIEIIDGDHITEPTVIEFFKSQATLLSGGPLDEGSGDGGDSGDSGGTGGDSGSSGGSVNIGPNAQLTEFLTGIANAIREKTGTSDPINPQDFATTIAEMQTGGGSEDELLESYVEGTLLNLNVDTITIVASNAFTGQNFYTASLVNCTSLNYNAFNACSNLLEINLPKCTIIGDSAFYSCSRLTTVNIPNCLSIYSSAFMYCPIQEISLPLCTQIRGNAFTYTGIQSINLPECTRLFTSAFQSASDLTYISIPKCTSIGANAFRACTNLESVYAPELLSTDYAPFGQCSNLISITLPKISSIASSMFEQCYNLKTVNIPECLRFNSYAFRNCSKLTSISAPKCSIVYSSAFYSC